MTDHTTRPSNPFAPGACALPLVAILRGLPPGDAAAVGKALYAAGFRLIEVPLNRSGALASMRALRDCLPADALVGAGTVLTAPQARAVADAGGQLAISPNFAPEVVATAIDAGLWSMAGVATPSEAFAALGAGAHALKAFPGEMLPPAVLKAWRTVLPEAPLYPVGGVTLQLLRDYRVAGVTGAGIGGALYREGEDPTELVLRAQAWREAWEQQ